MISRETPCIPQWGKVTRASRALQRLEGHALLDNFFLRRARKAQQLDLHLISHVALINSALNLTRFAAATRQRAKDEQPDKQ